MTLSVDKTVKGLALILVLSALSLTSHAQAASQCKGLKAQACSQSGACSWVAGYERKDGREVKAFCRSKGKSVSKQSKANVKQNDKTGS